MDARTEQTIREFRAVDRSDRVDSPSQRHLPLVDLLVDTRDELMDLAIAGRVCQVVEKRERVMNRL